MPKIPPALAAALLAAFPLGWWASGFQTHRNAPPPVVADGGPAVAAPGAAGAAKPAVTGREKSADAQSGGPAAAGAAPADDVTGRVFRAQRAMIEKLRTANLEDLSKMVKDTAGLADQYERRSVRELVYSFWARTDPASALPFMREYEQGTQLTNYLRALVRVDKEAALQAAQAIGPKDPGAASVQAMATEWARLDPDGFLRAAGSWPQHALAGSAWQGAMETLCRESPERARQAVDGMADSWSKRQAACGLTWQWAKADPDAALAYAQAQATPLLLGSAMRGVLSRLAETDVDRARSLFAEYRDKGLAASPGLVPEIPIAEGLARRNPKEAADFILAEVKPEYRAYYLRNTVSPFMGEAGAGDWVKILDAAQVSEGVAVDLHDPWGGFAAAAALPESPGRAMVLLQLAEQLSSLDPKRAVEAAQAAGPEAVALVAARAAQAMIERVEPGGFNRAASLVPDDQQGELYTDMATKLGETSPSKMEAFVNQIPEAGVQSESRVVAVRHWVAYQPALALDYVSRQPAQEQPVLTGHLTYAWTSQDAWAASQWVGGLDRGAVRDQAVFAMGSRLVQDEPASALAWSATIDDPDTRDRALLHVLGQWQGEDPEAARAAASTITLSPRVRERVLQLFNTEGGR